VCYPKRLLTFLGAVHCGGKWYHHFPCAFLFQYHPPKTFVYVSFGFYSIVVSPKNKPSPQTPQNPPSYFVFWLVISQSLLISHSHPFAFCISLTYMSIPTKTLHILLLQCSGCLFRWGVGVFLSSHLAHPLIRPIVAMLRCDPPRRNPSC